MANHPIIGFIGLGEAGFHLARGLAGEGVSEIVAFDINAHVPVLGEKIQARAEISGTRLLASSSKLAAASEIILSAVTSSAAAQAAEQTAPFLQERHFYMDINSVSPALKQSIGNKITDAGARFVEAAVMSPVPRHGHRVPMLLGGAHAQSLADRLTPYGMRLEVMSEQIGGASAVKMCRSIVIKGLEALLFECALGACQYGADERVFASLQETLPGLDWAKVAGYVISRVAEHGERRAHEMEEVAETLRAAGIEPMMVEATARRQAWGAHLDLLEKFGGKVPEDYRTVVRAIIDDEEGRATRQQSTVAS